MFAHFEKFIATELDLTKEQLKMVRSRVIEKKLRRRQLVLREGEICRYKIFVVKGLLRTFRTNDEGVEHIMRFAPENSWTLDAESYNNKRPSRFNIEAVEPSEVLMWSREDMDELFAAIPAFRNYSEKLKSNTLDASNERILLSISANSEEKYHAFVNAFPDVHRRVPLHMVASYLGVSRETLSRIRQAQLKQSGD